MGGSARNRIKFLRLEGAVVGRGDSRRRLARRQTAREAAVGHFRVAAGGAVGQDMRGVAQMQTQPSVLLRP